MANPDDLEKLCQGPRVWNAWREENPEIIPDLRNASFSLSQRQFGASNGGPINLADADLEGAELRHATLAGADLERANLTAADLVYSRLDGANLISADLTDAVLDYADLTDARLDRAILTGASLGNVRGLKQEQIATAHGDATTLLPAALMPPDSWFPPLDDDLVGEYPTPEPFYQTNLYEVLGVMPMAKPDEIRSAFRNLVKRLHPDLNPDDAEAQEAFKRVSSAYRILSDPDKRARYDRGEIGPDGEVSPEFEARRQFRRYARRFYAAAAASLLFAAGILGAVWYAVLISEGPEHGRVEIAVATPPKYAERLERNALADVPSPPTNSANTPAPASSDSGAEAGRETSKDASGSRPAPTKVESSAQALTGERKRPDRHTSKPNPADQSAGKQMAAKVARDIAASSAKAPPPDDARAEQQEASSTADTPSSDGKPLDAQAGKQVSPSSEKPAKPAKPDSPADRTQLARLTESDGANSAANAAAPTGNGSGSAGAQTTPSGTRPGPGNKEARAHPAHSAETRDADRPLAQAHSETEARPAQADAAGTDASAQQPVSGASSSEQQAEAVTPPSPSPHISLLLRRVQSLGFERDAVSDLFWQSAIKEALADRKTQATASVDSRLAPEKLGEQDEIWDLYTHSLPGAGEGDDHPWPESLRTEKTARPTLSSAQPAAPIAPDRPQKAHDRESALPAAKLRKQAVSDILAGGL